MIQPPSLKKGDTIGIVAPGRKIDAGSLGSAISLIESFGLKVLVGKNIQNATHSYLSGTDEERLHDLQLMMDNPDVKTILCARGGYGTTRIVDLLNFDQLLKDPKWICGFSDITALHLKLQKVGIQSIHCTMPILFGKPESKSSLESLMTLLEGKSALHKANANANNKAGSVTGHLIGGNLSLVVDSLGTSSEIDSRNKILVLEEVDEFVYRIDRMLVQLKRAGKFNQLLGMVIGHFTDMKQSELPFDESIEKMILHHTKEFSFPIGFNFSIGHQNPNMAWIQGGHGTLTVTKEKSTLMV